MIHACTKEYLIANVKDLFRFLWIRPRALVLHHRRTKVRMTMERYRKPAAAAAAAGAVDDVGDDADARRAASRCCRRRRRRRHRYCCCCCRRRRQPIGDSCSLEMATDSLPVLRRTDRTDVPSAAAAAAAAAEDSALMRCSDSSSLPGLDLFDMKTRSRSINNRIIIIIITG